MQEELDAHLQTKFRDDARSDLWLSIGAFLGGALVMYVLFYLMFGAFFVLVSSLPLGLDLEDDMMWAKIASGLMLAIAAFESWRLQRRLFEEQPEETGILGTTYSAFVYLASVGHSYRSVIPVMGSTTQSVSLLADLLYLGPRLLQNTLRYYRRSRARAEANPRATAYVLSLALAKKDRLTFEEIAAGSTEAEMDSVFEQLSWLDGVVYLGTEPLGIALTDTLREKLEAVVEGDG
ncbi:MAG: hypothetical protein AAF517_10655 [Planctomycetota bacterium]